MEPKDFDLEQSFPVEKPNKGRALPDSKSESQAPANKTWEEFCQDSKDMTPEERQKAFQQQVLGNPLAQKVIGKKKSPDKNATYIGLMATFFGVFGIHDLNCGNIRNGVLKLIFTCFGFATIISFFWTISDLIKLGNGTYKAANGIELGRAPWCKIVAIAELILFAASLIALIYFVSIFIMGAA